jgi:hypothetical protein
MEAITDKVHRKERSLYKDVKPQAFGLFLVPFDQRLTFGYVDLISIGITPITAPCPIATAPTPGVVR